MPAVRRYLGVCLLLVAGWNSLLAAAEVEPAFLYQELTAGRPDSFKIKLRTSKASEKVWIQAVDYGIDRKGRVSIEEQKEGRLSARSWCALKPTEVVLREGRDTDFEVPLRPPAGIPGGEYYLGIQVYTPVSGPVAEQGVTVKYEVNLVVLAILQVKGALPRIAGEVLEPVVTVENALPRVHATFHSQCTVSVIARTAVVIRDKKDEKIFDRFFLIGASSPHPDGQSFLLPDGMRDFSGEGNRKLPAGTYQAEIYSTFGPKKVRAVTRVDFQVEQGVAPVSPIEEIQITPANPVMEIGPGGVKYLTLELKNRGYGPVDLTLKSERPEVTFLPEQIKVEAGKVGKVRVGIRLPEAEQPRRDLPVRIVLTGGTEKDLKTYVIAIHAPGTAPKAEAPPAPSAPPAEKPEGPGAEEPKNDSGKP